ncbi:winged helix-turn-helix transcriptional regulator [Rhizobium leguminosarum]|uniref:Winged helix-turn-helix transcriptional regulator n=2 Tax=Rhizobium leguminosarum TaxID=384 RepID=A0AAJ1A528_RHILE|nr:MarR family winged helix-turn-helix transcriptional regulator [Rhizobium leguminosarum]MBY5532251.1 winged helix-turn-helix transcriptional regulator [Rhizobium leguminosarum]MBY5593558.1 winged helix-turn-helix transcriptional regulator [Rhizobium leguminosarum]MBY5627527.1 winged helix-turn-helix transcriptional regulator [Rhizobium leguminosarum]MBY5729825.1 winged helix-turn-helix transcriptional regulator [Rhizobium leguminosarum]
MNELQRTPAGTALTDLILDLFRLNNRMINAGDKLVEGLGLTSARWQVLGTVVTAGRPQPVAWLARDMGANRQNVQRIVNDLEKEGLLAFQPNPHHRRAQLVVLTDKGEQAYETAMRLQAPWVDMLSEGFQVEDLKTTHAVMKALRSKLE